MVGSGRRRVLGAEMGQPSACRARGSLERLPCPWPESASPKAACRCRGRVRLLAKVLLRRLGRQLEAEEQRRGQEAWAGRE